MARTRRQTEHRQLPEHRAHFGDSNEPINSSLCHTKSYFIDMARFLQLIDLTFSLQACTCITDVGNTLALRNPHSGIASTSVVGILKPRLHSPLFAESNGTVYFAPAPIFGPLERSTLPVDFVFTVQPTLFFEAGAQIRASIVYPVRYIWPDGCPRVRFSI